MIRVYQDKSKNILSTKKFIMEENSVIIGEGVLSLSEECISIIHAKVDEGLPFNYYDLLIRSMLHSVRDTGDIEIRILCDAVSPSCYFEHNEKSQLYKKLGFIKQQSCYTVLAKNINFKGNCNG